jgi:ankyrin repeat protein
MDNKKRKSDSNISPLAKRSTASDDECDLEFSDPTVERCVYPRSEFARKAVRGLEISESILFYLVSMDNEEELESCLRSGANPNFRGPSGITALYIACRCGHRRIAGVLVNAGADRDAQLPRIDGHDEDRMAATPGGDTPLHAACGTGDVELAKLILGSGHPSLNRPNQRGWTPLHISARSESLAMVELLLERGAIPSVVGQKHGFMALHEACTSGSVPIIDALIRADPKTVNGGKAAMTPIYVAAWHGNIPAVELLIERGAAVGGHEGREHAAFAACHENHSAIAKMLLRRESREYLESDLATFDLMNKACERGRIGIGWLLRRAKVPYRPSEFVCSYIISDTSEAALVFARGVHARLGSASPVALLAGFPHIREAITELMFGFGSDEILL